MLQAVILLRRMALAAAGVLALSACGGPDYVKDGASDDHRRKDQAECRAQVDELMVSERRIADDREATLGAQDQRQGRGLLPQQMAASEERNRSTRLMDDCMSARGWRANRRTWQFLG